MRPAMAARTEGRPTAYSRINSLSVGIMTPTGQSPCRMRSRKRLRSQLRTLVLSLSPNKLQPSPMRPSGATTNLLHEKISFFRPLFLDLREGMKNNDRTATPPEASERRIKALIHSVPGKGSRYTQMAALTSRVSLALDRPAAWLHQGKTSLAERALRRRIRRDLQFKQGP